MTTAEPFGSLEILNCGAGDVRLAAPGPDASEEDRTTYRTMITDMLQRGYALLIERKDGRTQRAKSFDPKRDVYIVASGPSTEEAVPVGEAKAHAVHRSAGG